MYGFYKLTNFVYFCLGMAPRLVYVRFCDSRLKKGEQGTMFAEETIVDNDCARRGKGLD
jgi:hypothetical protein